MLEALVINSLDTLGIDDMESLLAVRARLIDIRQAVVCREFQLAGFTAIDDFCHSSFRGQQRASGPTSQYQKGNPCECRENQNREQSETSAVEIGASVLVLAGVVVRRLDYTTSELLVKSFMANIGLNLA